MCRGNATRETRDVSELEITIKPYNFLFSKWEKLSSKTKFKSKAVYRSVVCLHKICIRKDMIPLTTKKNKLYP